MLWDDKVQDGDRSLHDNFYRNMHNQALKECMECSAENSKLHFIFPGDSGNVQKYVSTNRSPLQCKTLSAHFSNNMMVYCLLNLSSFMELTFISSGLICLKSYSFKHWIPFWQIFVSFQLEATLGIKCCTPCQTQAIAFNFNLNPVWEFHNYNCVLFWN